MSISEKRTQIYLTQDQHEKLQKAAAERSVSMAQVVREAVTSYLATPAAGTVQLPRGLDAEAYLADPAWRIPEVGESFEGLDWTDGAEHHDDYLYGPDRSGTGPSGKPTP